MDVPSPEEEADTLVRLLDVEELDANLFRGAVTPEQWKRTFGGQVAAQALAAAARTVAPDRAPHSLHAYFMRAGDARLPIIYQVFRDRDGGRFSSRRVVALQKGEPIFNFAASFHAPETGFAHQAPMPAVPAPETLPEETGISWSAQAGMPGKSLRAPLRSVEFRSVVPGQRRDPNPHPPLQNFWFRVRGRLPDTPLLHRIAITYASDMILLSTSLLPHPFSWGRDPLQEASLDHSVWLHEDARADEWLLYSMDSPWTGHARGLNRGQIFSRDGKLVASTAQEGLIRVPG
jgi:acyl-CoA thioesterase II